MTKKTQSNTPTKVVPLDKKILKLFNDPTAQLTYKHIHHQLGRKLYNQDEIIITTNLLFEKGLINKSKNKFTSLKALEPSIVTTNKIEEQSDFSGTENYSSDRRQYPDKNAKNDRGKNRHKNKNQHNYQDNPPAAQPSSKFVEGVIDMVSSGGAYLIVEGLQTDPYIAGARLNRALNGDRVRARVFTNQRRSRGGRTRLEAEVINVIERFKTQFSGIIKITNHRAILLADKANAIDLVIPLDAIGKAKDGDKVAVTLIDWPKEQKNPIGRVTKVLGKPGFNEAEMLAILTDSGFPLQFPPAVIAQATKLQTKIPEAEIARRRDMRKTPTFTIDPLNAKDFDDALSLQVLNNGHYEVGIHIADVTHYVAPQGALDREAFKRATSVYLVDRVLPMFPEKLSNEVCSLRPNEDKLCFSAIFEMNNEGHIINEWFGRTIIHSQRRFTYEEAQEVIDTQKGDMAKEIAILQQLALQLRAQRAAQGSINFNTTEVQFVLDEAGKPIDVKAKIMLDSNRLIEDFMLLANRRVARFINHTTISGKKIPSPNRIHDAPDIDKLTDFRRLAASLGYKLHFDSPKQIAHSLNSLLQQIQGKPEQPMLESLAIRSMAKAAYSTKNIGHYGLAFEDYAHFTSPIRRYPDVMIHRILSELLDNDKPNINFDEKAVEKQCLHCSQMERNALVAERTSIKHKQVEYMSERIGQNFEGVISGVVRFGLFVEMSDNKCEGLVSTDMLYDDVYVYDEANYAYIGRMNKKVYRLGDKVWVKVIRTDLPTRTIDLAIIDKPKANVTESATTNHVKSKTTDLGSLQVAAPKKKTTKTTTTKTRKKPRQNK
ncbi:MAG: ribonuclease R [Chitinophagales bacterium]|nr:ribonuclease R [Sphingobacteriales bacterium]MBP9140777.1 ribonuclease R [Chitinophagales bacterium]MCC7055942.1 ribonuclease R [Chitinophagales bacterium]